ncbi:MAG: molybdopterin-dependent oxidoreductase [Dehalococcoidia bacterium]|nr:molybdopterin-dependent oxidoreductase [Dehalococcoidia bacterium]
MVATNGYKVIGTRPIRPDGTDKVTGRAQYGADIRLTGMLYGKVKRSPHAHAVIKRIDASRALALPGVKAVVTRADFPEPAPGANDGEEGPVTPLRYLLDRIIASRKALFKGHAVAAVCATDAHIAEDALDLIDVEYEVLPAVFNVREAMLDVAPILHDDLRTREQTVLSVDNPEDKPTNIASHRQFVKGDLAQGFAEADVIVEREFETSRYHQGYIEPQNGTAYWNKDGHVSIWASTQGLFGVRNSISQILQIPVSQVTVNAMEIGGGFGGKLGIYLEPLAALLSKKTGKPVKITMNRDEVFEATGPTSATYVRVKAGAKRDGTITAGEAMLAYEAGAYPGSPVGGGMNGVFAPYDIPNQQVDGYDVVTNLSKTAAYRAPGTPAGMFAGESVINELAERLGMDPIELRIKNAAVEGTVRANGQRFRRIGALEVMQAIRDHPHYRSELEGENRGRGIALGFWGNGGGETSSSAAINADGTVNLVLGSVDIGGTRASIAMQLAETLGIGVDRVIPKVVDTDSVGFTGNTGGSRITFAGGWAAHDLGHEIRRQLIARAAKIWECEPGAVTYADDGVLQGPPDAEGKERSLSFEQLAAQLPRTGGTIDAGVNINYSTQGPAFAGHIVDVEIDPDTGKTTVLRYTAVQDVGTAIHPSYVEGQIQGGVAQGAGMALLEEYYLGADGHIQNASFLDYRMPTALDLPMIETVLVEVPNPGHPYGVRGVGEVPIVPPLAAIQTAVYNATGLRFTSLPMSPRVVLEGLLDKV